MGSLQESQVEKSIKERMEGNSDRRRAMCKEKELEWPNYYTFLNSNQRMEKSILGCCTTEFINEPELHVAT